MPKQVSVWWVVAAHFLIGYVVIPKIILLTISFLPSWLSPISATDFSSLSVAAKFFTLIYMPVVILFSTWISVYISSLCIKKLFIIDSPVLVVNVSTIFVFLLNITFDPSVLFLSIIKNILEPSFIVLIFSFYIFSWIYVKKNV
jgi:hypothetical protein